MVFEVIVPILFLLVLGYLCVRLQLLSKDQAGTVGTFVVKIALPALLFQSLASKDLHEIWYPSYFFVYASASLLIYGAAFYTVLRCFKNTFSQSAVLALGAGMSNTGMIGTAVLTLLMGASAMTYITPVLIIESVLTIPMVLILAEAGAQKNVQIGVIIQNTLGMLLKNPLFSSVLLGLAFAVFKIPVPDILMQVFTMLGHTASPLALFAIGGGIFGMSLKYLNLQSLFLVVCSNIMMPLLVFLGLYYLTDVSREMRVAGTLIASLPMPTIFGILGPAYGLNDKTLTPLLISTIFGFAVTSVLIAVMYA